MIGTILGWLTGGFADKLVGLGQAYFNKQISQAQYEAEVKKAASEAAAKVEASWADAAKGISASTNDMLRATPIMQRAFAIVLFLQVFVLVWYQLGAPAYAIITGTAWPDPGVTLEYAYLLIGGMVGLGPFVFKRGA